MKNNKRIISILLTLILTIICFAKIEPAEASAGSKYITVNDYLKYIVTEMNFMLDETSENPYIDTAMRVGLIKEGDFKDYSEYLTRTDAAVIVNRLDELINSHFPEEIISFLRECNLFEGRLYYDLDGSLYPTGETDETYDAREFSKVLTPILTSAFPSDTWVEQGLRTRYKDIYDRKGNFKKTVIMIGMASPNKSNVVEILPFDENSKIISIWNYIKDMDRKVNIVLEKRISDIKDIPKDKREAVASIVAKGIIKGYSNGLYVQNREFRGNNKITANGAKEVIQKVLNPEKRALISPDGQLIRTKNLPKNASDYPYILECFPNEYYEMNYSFMYLTGFEDGSDRDVYAYPKEINYDYLYDNYYDFQFNIEMDKYELYDLAFSQVEKYLNHVFNVDYRTVNDKWKEGLESSLTQGNSDWRIKNWINDYVEAIKKNRVIVECEHIAIDKGTLYETVGSLYVRAYVKYKITAGNINVDHSELLYGDNTFIKDLENGKWRYGYYDIQISSSNETNGYQWGVHSAYSINDGWNNLLK